MATRTARTSWSGSVSEGSGEVTLASSGVGTFPVSFPKRAADDADRTTSPEELIAGALTSCYAMQFSALLGQAGGTPTNLDVTAEVDFGPDPDGGFRIPGIRLRVRGAVPELDDATFRRVAEEAKTTCPVSKALAAVPISLDAALG
jgi:osmotically inducible protein OsmC